MRFLKTFFRFCTIVTLCSTFTGAVWGTDCQTNIIQANTCNKHEGCYNNEGWGKSKCHECPVGNKCPYSTESSKTPQACNNGTYQDLKGQAGCKTCSAGTMTPNDGNAYTSCTKCSAGTFSAAGASSCSNCAPGTYSGAAGASSCTKCPVGFYQSAGGQKDCDKCPDGTTTKNTGSTDSSQCIKKFNLKLYAEYQENGTTKQTLVSDSTHSFYAGDLNLFSGYTAQQVIGGKLGSAPLNNKWEYKPNKDKAYITVNGTNYNLAYNGTNWFWKSSNDMSILDTQANGSTFNLVFILTPKTYNVYMISSGVYNNSPVSMFSANTNAVATKNFGSTPADGLQPDQDKVQSCSFSASATATYYGYIASGTTPKYYECKRNSANFSLITNRSNGSTRMFEPASADNDICVGYDMTTCERGYSCNSCDRTACTTGTYQDATGQSSCKNCSTQTSNK